MKLGPTIKRLFAKSGVSVSDKLDEKILGDALCAFDISAKPGSQAPSVWRIIMNSRITKLAVAAVIIVAVFVGINQFVGPVHLTGVVLGEVLEKVESIESFVFQHKMSVKGAPGLPEGKTVDIESTVYVSSEYGLRQDKFVGDMAISRAYVPPSGTVITEVMPHIKKYILASMTEEQIREMHEEVDPAEMIKEFMSFEHTYLGRDIVDGVEAEGIEVDDPNFGIMMFESAKGRLWIDVETDLPVRIEVEGVSSGGSVEMKIIAYEFDWEANLGAEVFEPNIPDDYALHAEVDISNNEEAAIGGLRLFAELVVGQYPSNLDIMTASIQAGNALQAQVADDPNWDPNNPVTKEDMEKAVGIQATCMFYGKLVEDDKDAAYYGEKVTAEDSNMVLLRWKVSEDEYRVIFGDLTAENVSAEQLAELENDAEFLQILSQPRKMAPYKMTSEFIGHQADEWHVVSPERIVVHSDVTIARWPEGAATMDINLPYSSATVESATFGEIELQYDIIGDGVYRLGLPQEWSLEAEKKIEVVWVLAPATLEEPDGSYRTVLESLISVYSYSLKILLEDGCGFEHTEDSSKKMVSAFSWSSHKAKGSFGSVGLLMKKAE